MGRVRALGIIEGYALSFEKQLILTKIREYIRQREVISSEVAFAPSWLLDDALHSEISENWKHAYLEISALEVGAQASLIELHVVYKVKDDVRFYLLLKARLVLHGNRDRDRFSVCRDSASADLSVVRLLISLSQILDFKLCTADIYGTFMLSGPTTRELYVLLLGQLLPEMDCGNSYGFPTATLRLVDKGYALLRTGCNKHLIFRRPSRSTDSFTNEGKMTASFCWWKKWSTTLLFPAPLKASSNSSQN